MPTTTATKIRMKDQLLGVTAQGDVITIQLWAGFLRSRAAVVSLINGGAARQQAGPLRQIERAFAARSLGPGSRLISEGEARRLLAAKGVRPQGCTNCREVLPIGEQWCARCGTVYGARQ